MSDFIAISSDSVRRLSRNRIESGLDTGVRPALLSFHEDLAFIVFCSLSLPSERGQGSEVEIVIKKGPENNSNLKSL